MVESLALSVKEVVALDAAAMTDDELSDLVVELQRQRDALEAAHTRMARAWDARRVWASDGAKSGTTWLAKRTRAPKSRCGGLLWLGRETAHVRLLAAAWEAGEVGADHVRRLVDAHNARTAEAFDRDLPMLLDLAMSLTFAEFTQALDYWSLHADPDGASESNVERRERRRASFDETITGMWTGSQLLDPMSGTIVADEWRRLEKELFEADWAEAKARLGREPKLFELARTPDQRRADSLVEMARRSSRPDDQAGRPARPLFTILFGAEQFAHLCQLASGQVLSPSALVPWIAEADLERILFDGGPSRVIEVSWKRTFEGALRRLIQVRDQFCYHPYCDVPADRCQVDHIKPHSQGGVTAQWNGRLACGFHNRRRNHERRGPPPDEGDSLA